MVLLLALALLGAPPPRVDVSATFLPAEKGRPAAIALTLEPQDPQVRVNESPAPRVKLAASQNVLVDKQAPAKPMGADPSAQTRYLDPMLPFLVPVAVAPGTPAGNHPVAATVTYYYCSKTEGWCRKGTADVSLDVRVK